MLGYSNAKGFEIADPIDAYDVAREISRDLGGVSGILGAMADSSNAIEPESLAVLEDMILTAHYGLEEALPFFEKAIKKDA